MRKMLVIFAVMLAAAFGAVAEERTLEHPGDGRIQYCKGYYWIRDEAGDSMIVYVMTDLVVYPAMRFKNEKERQEYNRLVRNVKLTLPYAKLIAETLVETYEYLETFPTQKERDQYLKKMEKEIFAQYKPVLKKFSRTQARILVKLIQRETHQSSYNILKAFLGTFRASFWQGFGKLFGVSLKGTYRPDSDSEDSRIERIASQVELGLL